MNLEVIFLNKALRGFLGLAVIATGSMEPAEAATNEQTTATIYVGRHFEVRDLDQPTKYVFNGATRVASITGSLSANTRVQRMRLYSGWNLLSLAVFTTNVLHQITNANPSILRSPTILCWNDSTRTWLGLSAVQALPAGTILWLDISTDSALTLTGAYAEPTNRTIGTGGGFLPSAGLEAWDFRSAISNVPSAAAWAYDASIARWLFWLPQVLREQSDFTPFIAPGQAVYLAAANPVQLKVPEPGLRIRYYHQDHLGSSSVMTGADGRPIDETSFFPFGTVRNEFRSRLAGEPYAFTQKERDRESGLLYFGKRYYASTIAKWLTTDPKEEAGGGLNLYAYVNQNPLKYLDPDGAEISVGKPTVDDKGVTTYRIEVKAALMDVAEAHPSQQFSRSTLEAYRKDLEETIKNRYSMFDPKTKTRWETTVTIRLLEPSEQAAANEHVFMIVGGYKMSGAGQTRFRPKGEHEKERGMIMRIQAHSLLDPRPDKLHPNRIYKSPESIGAHEFGHAAGLDDLETDKKNLMSHGRENDSQKITFDQMRTIVNQFQRGNLNKRLE